MKKLLEALTAIFHGVFIDWFPNFLKMTAGVISEFLDTLDYATAIIIGIFALIRIGIGIIKRWLNR